MQPSRMESVEVSKSGNREPHCVRTVVLQNIHRFLFLANIRHIFWTFGICLVILPLVCPDVMKCTEKTTDLGYNG